MCDCDLEEIGKECGKNAPGLKTTIWVACVDDIASIGAATNHAVATITATAFDAGPPEIEAGGFVPWSIIRTDSNAESTPNENGGYNSPITGFISKNSAAKSNILTQCDNNENFIVITKDQNGLMEIHGDLEHPVKIGVGRTKSPRNGYNLSILWEGHSDLPLIFTGTVPLKP